MDGWLKVLVAAASVVVIAGGGYFAWSEYQRGIEAKEAKQVAEFREQRSMCDLMMRELASGSLKQDWRVIHVVNCVLDGHVKEEDFNTPRLSVFLEAAQESIEFARKKRASGTPQ